MLATLSAALLTGTGRGDREALEGLCLGVGSLEGPLISGLLSLDWCESIIICRGNHRGGGGGSCALLQRRRQFPSRGLCGHSLLFILDLFFPRDVFTPQRCVSTSLTCSCSSFTAHFHGNCFRDFRWRTLLSSYDIIIFLFQSMESKSLQEGGPHLFESFSFPSQLGSLISSPVGMEGRLTWPLHILRRGLYPCEMLAVVQLLSLEDYLMAPSMGIDSLSVVVKVVEVVSMYLLIKVI